MPSIEESVLNEERRERTRRLARTADERWVTQGEQCVKRLAVGSGCMYF